MKIIRLQAENIKKLTAVEIIPTDNMITITGENGAGKSSILDSITMALCGGKEIPEQPLKKGTEKGKIVIDLESYQITRSFTKDNSYLKIEALDGQKISSPQKFLDDLVGKISFDPLEFINRDKLEQRRVLLELIGVNVDELDKKEKDLREERTIVGRDVKRTESLAKSATRYPEITETKEETIADVTRELSDAILFNRKLDSDLADNEKLKEQAGIHRNRIEKIDQDIKLLQDEKAGLEKEIEEKKSAYKSKKEVLESAQRKDTDTIQAKMTELESKNTKIRANQTYQTAQAEFKSFSKSYDTLTKKIEAVESERKNLLSSATMPVDGLSFNESELLYNGIPLAQASDGEKLMISLGISMALNPKLRVLRIKDGSLLDAKNRKIIADQIKDKDFQLWLESVSSDKKVGIFIEEGEIVAIDGKEPERAPEFKLPPKGDSLLVNIKKEKNPASAEKKVVETPEGW